MLNKSDTYHLSVVLCFAILLLASRSLQSQCITNIDFNTWSQAGYTANGNWAVQNAGSQVHQTVNGNPTFFISPFKLICVKITGDFKTANNDDDFMGFVFSFLNPIGQSDTYDAWLFDWKQVAQASGGYTGQNGKALNRVKGTIPSSAYTQTFWGHQNTPEFTVKQNDFGGAGWVKNFNHHFELRLSYSRATIFIDGDSVFDLEDCYLPGYFGFYNYSQPDCYYSNFNFEPYINFDVLTPQICLGDTAKFQFVNICQDSSLYDFSSFQSMTWDFGDGNTFVNNNISINNVNTSHLYAQPGTYNVVLSVQDYQGCIGRDTQQVVVSGLPTVAFSAPNVCFGSVSFFTNQSSANADSIVSSIWNFDEVSSGMANTSALLSPSHNYATCDTFNVKLTVVTNKGCADSTIQPVIVNCLPTAGYTAASACLHSPITFADSSSSDVTSWSWDFGDNTTSSQQNPNHIYASCGNFNARLIVSTGAFCKDTVIHPVVVHCPPIANFGTNKVCQGTPTVFNDSSSTTGNISSWLWNFGDNTSPSFLQGTSHLYGLGGTYTATLMVTNNFGCADTVTKPVMVYFNPTTNFTVQNVCLNDSVYFTDSSYVHNSASVDSYLWVFGDGTPTNGYENPTHLYTEAGAYNVTLLSTTNQGCANASSKTVYVFDPPVAAFTAQDECLTDTVAFVNASGNPTLGTIASVLWSFGDGSLLNNTVTSPHHLYTAPGIYPVTLIVRSSNLACADTVTDSITVFPIPIAEFSVNEVCHNTPMNFNDSSIAGINSNITGWSWSFGDNGASLLQDPVHTYDAFGEYTISLIVTTDQGCKDTINKSAVVHPLPHAVFITNNICLGDSALFTDQSTISTNVTNDVISFWNWDLGDNGATLNTTNAAHLYASGTYTVELKIISDFGCADSLSKTIVVNPKPVVNFNADDTVGCEPLCVTFTDASVIYPGTNVSWSWNIGNDSVTGTTGSYCFNNDLVFDPKQYSVTLTVVSDSGCVSSHTKANYITVYPEPDAVFTALPANTTITDPVIYVTNLSTGGSVWNWNFSNGDTSSLQYPTAQTYPDTGSYSISLIVSTQYGCMDTAYQTVIIEPDFMFYIPSAFTPNGDGVNDVFIPKGVFVNEFEMSIFDRWGNLVFKTDDISKAWNGMVNNNVEPAQMDVYVYSVIVKDFKQQIHKYQGVVSLLK